MEATSVLLSQKIKGLIPGAAMETFANKVNLKTLTTTGRYTFADLLFVMPLTSKEKNNKYILNYHIF